MSVMGIFKKHPWCPKGINRSKCQRNSKKEWNSILLQDFSFLQQTVMKKFSISLHICVCWGWGRIVFNFIFKWEGQPDAGEIRSFFLPRHLNPCVRQLLPPAHPPTHRRLAPCHALKQHSPLSHLKVLRGFSLGNGRAGNLCLNAAEW